MVRAAGVWMCRSSGLTKWLANQPLAATAVVWAEAAAAGMRAPCGAVNEAGGGSSGGGGGGGGTKALVGGSKPGATGS